MKKLVDDDGNELPTPEPGSDVAKLIYLMEYCRRRRFQLGPRVQLGDVVVEVVDMDLVRGAAPQSRPVDPDFARLLTEDE